MGLDKARVVREGHIPTTTEKGAENCLLLPTVCRHSSTHFESGATALLLVGGQLILV